LIKNYYIEKYQFFMHFNKNKYQKLYAIKRRNIGPYNINDLK